MARWVKRVLCMSKDPSWDPQNAHKLDAVAPICNPVLLTARWKQRH